MHWFSPLGIPDPYFELTCEQIHADIGSQHSVFSSTFELLLEPTLEQADLDVNGWPQHETPNNIFVNQLDESRRRKQWRGNTEEEALQEQS